MYDKQQSSTGTTGAVLAELGLVAPLMPPFSSGCVTGTVLLAPGAVLCDCITCICTACTLVGVLVILRVTVSGGVMTDTTIVHFVRLQRRC